MNVKWMGLVLILFLSTSVSGQGLFEEAEKSKEKELAFELNGYLRSTLYLGKVLEENKADLKSGFGEFSLKLKASKKSFGSAFAEVRYRSGYEFNNEISELNLREAYVSAYVGRFDFKLGHQIVVWGRADGINPTDNITPKNMLSRSPDEDDRRAANFLLRAFYNARPVRFEFIWVPVFRSSVVPTDMIEFPPGITLGDLVYPDTSLENSAWAVKLNLELASIDGSFSYFDGHNPFPGISLDYLLPLPGSPVPGMMISLESYRMRVFGADFSTTVAGSFGLRGEIAYTRPLGDYISSAHIPNPDFRYVFGVDKEFSGNFSVILQYLGRYVYDFVPLVVPVDPVDIPAYELELTNRIITFQQYETSHSFSCRLGWNLLHEAMELELLGLVNLTSEEFFLRARMAYDIADAFTLTVGGELYSGPEDTLFDFIEDHLSSVFAELKISF
ncbi:MAG: hypothetical protein PVI11_08125 [Candidatus Aminicenantes bacterium]|jgi:hypothetical protein